MTPQAYKITKNSRTGERFIRFADGNAIPATVAMLCSGADKWISEIPCKCRDCGERFPLRALVSGIYCETCVAAEIE